MYNKFSKQNSSRFNNSNSRQNTNSLGNDILELSSDKKYNILHYLYQNIDLYQVRYSILKNTDHAQILKTQQFHVVPHYHGYNYYLIIKDNKIFLIFKMDLKMTLNELDPNNVKMYEILENNNVNLYNNTIIDGKLIYKKDQKSFLIHDILYFKGTKLLTHKLEDKLSMINQELSDLNKLINLQMKLIRLYTYDDISDLVYNKIKNSDCKINGLIFLPIRSGRYYIYMNDQEFENIKSSPSIEINKNIANIKISSGTNIINKELLLQKTQIADVYEVYSLDKLCRFGVACIPNIKMSHYLRKYFNTHDQIITECSFDNKFSKWKPILNIKD